MKTCHNVIKLFAMTSVFIIVEAAAVEGIVIDSNVDAYPLGHIVTDNTTLNIPADRVVKVYFETDESRIIFGPHSGPISAAFKLNYAATKRDGVIPKLIKLLTETPKHYVTGASRGIDADDSSLSPWAIPVGKSIVPFCLPDKKAAVISRVENDKQMQVLIRNPDTDEEAILTFATSVNEVEWPSTLPITDGAQFLIKASRTDLGKLVKFKILENDYDNEADLAFALAERNCERQALFLLQQVTTEFTPAVN